MRWSTSSPPRTRIKVNPISKLPTICAAAAIGTVLAGCVPVPLASGYEDASRQNVPASVPDAMRGYKEIHLRALKLLRPGGVLATFCCSHHVDTRLFQDVILSAAFDARKVLRRVAQYTQSPDHPVLPSVPETECF